MVPEGLVWKYLGVDADSGRARVPLLDDVEFRVTPPNQLNDPFEAKPTVRIDVFSKEDWKVARATADASGAYENDPSDAEVEHFHLLTTPAHRRDESNFPGLWPMSLPELRPEPFQTMAELDEFRAESLRAGVEDTLSSKIGVFSLSGDPASLLMWSHYAENHRGCAVGFDPCHPVFQTEGLLQSVDYDEERTSITVNGGLFRVAGHEVEDPRRLPVEALLRKDNCWAYEQERRFLVPLERTRIVRGGGSSDDIALFSFPPNAIQCLILGASVAAVEARKIHDRLAADDRWRHLVVFHARLNTDRFALDFEEI